MDNKAMTAVGKAKKVSVSRKDKYIFAPYLFISPFYILFLIFGAFPIFYSLYLSFYSWNGIREMTFIGLDNFYFLLIKDSLFWKALSQTFIINLLSGIPQHLTAIAFAFILNVGLVKLKNFFKGVFFLPYITSTAAVCMVFYIIFGQENGLLNMILYKLKDIGFLSLFGNFELPIYFFRWQLQWVTLSILIFWKWTGWNIIIYLAGLQAIPGEIYDAARIDGASWFHVFKDVTVPMMKPIIFFATSVTIIFGMQIFDEPMILLGLEHVTNNGYFGLTTTAYTYLYAFRWGKLGLAAASSYALCLIIIILSNIYRKIMNNGEA